MSVAPGGEFWYGRTYGDITMWKRIEEIPAHNQSVGRSEKHDPFEWIRTIVTEVEAMWLDGDDVVLSTCCESARLRRDTVVAWRELPGQDGHASTYEVRITVGADVIAQRAAQASYDQPACRRCGRQWDGLPPARGRDEHRVGADGPSAHDRAHGDHHGNGHGGHHSHDGQHGAPPPPPPPPGRGCGDDGDYPGRPRHGERRD